MAKRALLVGINDYQSINDLSGCVNDVTNMRSILKTYCGFQNADLRVWCQHLDRISLDKRESSPPISDRTS